MSLTGLSKLSYLSKYTDDKKKRKQKEKKTEKRKEFYDDDLAMPSPPRDEEEDDEGPTVVIDVAQESISYQNDTNGRLHDSDDKPRRRRRYDSDDEEQSRKKPNHDSGDDAPRRARYDSDAAASKPSRRHDSDDGDARNGPRRRYDSDDDDGMQRRRRYDSDDDVGVQRRRRYDSDDDNGVRRTWRYDSDDDDDNDVRSKPNRRIDSDEERSKPRRRPDSNGYEPRRKPRRRYDSDDDLSSSQRTDREKMSSGHSAGLQKARDFREAEWKIQRRRHEEAQEMVDRHGMGETIFRDEEGRKVDADQAKQTKMLPQLSEKESALLNKGRVQKEQEEVYKREWENVQASSFARHRNDSELDDLRRDAIREGDPMASHAAQKNSKARAANGKPERPVYKGPAPKPNRFGIPPGYRWDGVDRGNGFEDKVLARGALIQHKKEQAYRWSSADM